MLRALDCSPDVIDMVRAEVGHAARSLVYQQVRGTEPEDLEAIAATAVWQARTEQPDISDAYLRVKVRSAVRDAVRAEYRAVGSVRHTFRWPFYRPVEGRLSPARPSFKVRRCRDCPTRLEGLRQQRCQVCRAHRRRAQQQVHNATYYRRLFKEAA
jgi:hypothetical protein